MEELEKELKKLTDRGALGVSLTLKSVNANKSKCAKEMVEFLRSMNKEKAKVIQ